jgi:hypothetical protein
LYRNPTIITSSTNRNVLQPTKLNRKRRKHQIDKIQEDVSKGKMRSGSPSSASSRPKPSKNPSASSSSASDGQSQLVDLVVEDEAAEEVERARARKEGSPRWNVTQPKHFVYVNPITLYIYLLTSCYSRTYPSNEEGEEVREGYAPDKVDPLQPHDPEHTHNLDQPVRESEASEEAGEWDDREYSQSREAPKFGSFSEEHGVWGSDSPKKGQSG